jgi:glycosyltransferase involved in cell wall biosynthesis
LFVGSIFNRRFLPQKTQAFIEFGKTCSDYQFLIIGRNHTKPFQDIGALVAEANKILGREAIIWKNYAPDEDLVYLYNGAFATLWLSSYEGFGLPVLESMACGTPVITSMKGALPEVAGDAAMYVVHPENPAEISSALAHLTRYGRYREELIVKGLERARTFSWKKCADLTLDKILNFI